jgi:putative acetyltransferase
MDIRRFDARDSAAVLPLLKETIFSVNLRDYTKEQCEVWANSFSDIEALKERLEKSLTYIAEFDGRIVGFGNVNGFGEIDLLYVHKNFQRRGIASALLTKLEAEAKSYGLVELTTEASITARPFFESKGYQVEAEQIKIVRECEFINFRMKKGLL